MVLIKNFLFFIFIGHLLFAIPSNTKDINLDKFLEKKITNSLSKVFDTNNFQYKEIKKNYNGIIFEVFDDSRPLGYFALCRAKSMYDVFDYAIFFDLDSQIKDIRIFSYNEDYGYEITARWFLKQFFGKKAGDRMSYNYDIDGISGATVSVKSITNDIKNTSKEVSEIVIDKFYGF
tara:strand:+ start:234 stop:761 length:528 start_codon:yes stop_codon:yes gene_type:complete